MKTIKNTIMLSVLALAAFAPSVTEASFTGYFSPRAEKASLGGVVVVATAAVVSYLGYKLLKARSASQVISAQDTDQVDVEQGQKPAVESVATAAVAADSRGWVNRLTLGHFGNPTSTVEEAPVAPKSAIELGKEALETVNPDLVAKIEDRSQVVKLDIKQLQEVLESVGQDANVKAYLIKAAHNRSTGINFIGSPGIKQSMFSMVS